MLNTLPLLAVIAALIVALVVMALTYGYAEQIDNYSVVDVAWSLNFTAITVVYTLLSNGQLDQRVLMLVLVSLWSLRLASHLHHRIKGKPEEGRYVELRRKWSFDGVDAFKQKMWRFYKLQAYSNVILSLPILVVCFNPRATLSTLEWVGASIMAIAVLGEASADWQLARFKANPNNQGQVCQVGLWHYSRHPNYFFEWCFWVGLAVVSLDSGWTGLVGPIMAALMLYLLLKVTGVKATEDQTLRSKGEEYQRYQRTTSGFVPWFKKVEKQQ